MDPLKEMVFMGEIVLQSKIALRAGDNLPTTYDNFDRLEIWSSIQLILVAAANVSKILWPNKKFESRGQKLRKLLNVDQNNLLSERKFRNHFEHYDERIEKWFDEQPSAVYRDLDIDPLKSFRGITDNNKNRVYDPLKRSIDFRGESLDLGAILNELEDILNKCRPNTLV